MSSNNNKKKRSNDLLIFLFVMKVSINYLILLIKNLKSYLKMNWIEYFLKIINNLIYTLKDIKNIYYVGVFEIFLGL